MLNTTELRKQWEDVKLRTRASDKMNQWSCQNAPAMLDELDRFQRGILLLQEALEKEEKENEPLHAEIDRLNLELVKVQRDHAAMQILRSMPNADRMLFTLADGMWRVGVEDGRSVDGDCELTDPADATLAWAAKFWEQGEKGNGE